MLQFSLTTVAWLVLGLLGGAALLAYSKRDGRARKKVLANALVIAAAIYVIFALASGSGVWTLYELVGVAIFLVFARLGVSRSPSWLALGWALHPLWDAGLHLHGHGASFAPEWYVVACISFDLLVAAAIQYQRKQL